MEIQIKTLTPATARAMLRASKTKNRLLSNQTVNVYRSDMKSGKWVQNGQTITINRSGDIIDGHHRLQALEGCEGVSIVVPVVTVDDSSAIETIDIGRTRTIPDLFEMKLNRNANLGKLAASLSILIQGHQYTGNKSYQAKYEAIRDVYFAYESGLNWALLNGWQTGPDAGPRTKVRNTIRPGTKATTALWAALGGVYACNRDLAEFILADLSSSSENISQLGLAMNRIMLHHVDRPTDKRTNYWYEERYVMGINHYIAGTSVSRITRKFSSGSVKLRLDLIGQNWDVIDD